MVLECGPFVNYTGIIRGFNPSSNGNGAGIFSGSSNPLIIMVCFNPSSNGNGAGIF